MLDILRAEWMKWSRLSTVWLVLGVYLLMVAGGLWLVETFVNGFQSAAEGEAAQFLTPSKVFIGCFWLASFLHYLVAAVVTLIICLEFTTRMFKQQTVNGVGPDKLIFGKIGIGLILSLVAGVYVLLLTLIRVDEPPKSELFPTFGGFVLQCFAYLSVASLFAFLQKKPLPAIIIFIAYGLLGENIIGTLIESFAGVEVIQYLPFTVFSGLLVSPFAEYADPNTVKTLSKEMTYGLSISYIGVFWFINYLLLAKRDS